MPFHWQICKYKSFVPYNFRVPKNQMVVSLVLSWISLDGVAGGEGLPNAPLGWCLNYNTIFKTVFQMGSISIWWFYHIAVVKHSEVLHSKNWEILSKPHPQINLISTLGCVWHDYHFTSPFLHQQTGL